MASGNINRLNRLFTILQGRIYFQSKSKRIMQMTLDKLAEKLIMDWIWNNKFTLQLYCAADNYTTIKYFSFFEKVACEYTCGKKEPDLISFIHSNMGVLQKEPKSNQAAGFGASVVLLTDDNFESIISQPKPTFVMFYATWCGHCSTTKPAYSRVATAFKTEKSDVNIVAIDAAENPKTADFAGIQNLPTFKLYVSNKEVAVYDGDRSMEDMVKFIKSKV